MSTAWSLFSTAGHIDVLESILDLLDWKSLLACSAVRTSTTCAADSRPLDILTN